MHLSIVIPAFNEAKLLPSTLAAIQQARGALKVPTWSSEIIVCDNNSTDNTRAIALDHGADRVVFEPINQISRARNTGAQAAAGRWILFIDADSQPSFQLFEAMLKAIQSGRVIAGGSTVTLDSAERRAQIGGLIWNTISRLGRLMAGSFIFIEAAAFREIGGFSERFYAAEELDLTHRLRPLARQQQRQIVILTSAPLLTSARKLHLYTPNEIRRLILRSVFRSKTTLTSKEACHLWYDGRR